MSSSLLSLPGNETTTIKNTTISTVGDKKNDAMTTTTTMTPIMMIPSETNNNKSLTKYTATATTAKPSSSSSTTTKTTTTSITDWEASVSLAKAIMGAGSFALPWAFSKMGYIAGPIFLTIFLVLSVHSIGLLVECSRWMRQQQQQQQQQQETQKTTATTTTYVDIAQATFGNNGARLTYIASISASIGVCGSYLVFIAVNLESLFSLLLPLLLSSSSSSSSSTTTTTTIVEVVEGITSVKGNKDEQHEMSTSTSNSSNDVTFLVIIIWTIAMPIAVMLSSVRNPKRFATVSFWGDISVIAGMIAVLIYGTIIATTTTIAATSTGAGTGTGTGTGTGYDYTEVNTDDNNNYYEDDNDNDGRNKCVAIGSLHDMALAFGSIGYLFLVHFLILPIESSMLVIEVEHEHDDENNKDVNNNNENNNNRNNEKNHHRRFMKVVQRTFTVCGFIGGSFGIAGYLLFGKHTQQIVLMNVVSGDNGSGIGIMATVQFLLCIDLIFTYPVVMRPSIVILEQQLLRRRHHHRRRRKRQNTRTGTTTVTTNTTLSSSSPSTSPPRLRLSDNRYRSNKRDNLDDDVNGNINSNSNVISNDNDNDFLDDNEVDIDSDNIEWTTHIIICSILGIIAASAGSFIPAFGLLSGLVGGVSQTFLAIVLPPLMWSKIQQKQKQRSNPTSTFTTSSINSNDAVWASSFYYLPRKEKMLVLCGFGLILWTLHSTWSELN